MVTLNRTLDYDIKDYKYNHREEMSTAAVASLLGNTLYNRRFFPFYAFNVLAGLDEEGHGVIYSYDAVGSYELLKYGVQGSAQSHIIPIMDSCVAKRNRNVPYVDLDREEALNLIKEVFTVATERDKDTGDRVEIKIISAAGIETDTLLLRSDWRVCCSKQGCAIVTNWFQLRPHLPHKDCHPSPGSLPAPSPPHSSVPACALGQDG